MQYSSVSYGPYLGIMGVQEQCDYTRFDTNNTVTNIHTTVYVRYQYI